MQCRSADPQRSAAAQCRSAVPQQKRPMQCRSEVQPHCKVRVQSRSGLPQCIDLPQSKVLPQPMRPNLLTNSPCQLEL